MPRTTEQSDLDYLEELCDQIPLGSNAPEPDMVTVGKAMMALHAARQNLAREIARIERGFGLPGGR